MDRRTLLGGLAAGAIAVPVLAGTAGDPLADRLRDGARALLTEQDVPALGFGLVRDGRIVAVDAFGLADRETGRGVTPDTAFHLASVSKVVTGTALMQLQEMGRFRLDDPIAPFLDFALENPRHATPITFRHLATHTSSISDRNYENGDFGSEGDPTLGLRDFLIGYLTPGGKWYNDHTFGDVEPGSRFSYSNVGTALVGYLAERIGKAPLQLQCQQRIFAPLGMHPAAWHLSTLGAAPVTTPYVEDDGKLHPIKPVGYPDWPAGLLRTTPRGLTRFVAAYANGGTLDGRRILRGSTVREMVKFVVPPPLPRGPLRGQGLFWENQIADAPQLIAKFGGDEGAHTMVAFDPVKRHGIALLANRSPNGMLEEAMKKLAVAALA